MRKILFSIFKNLAGMLNGYGLSKFYPINIIWPKIYQFCFSKFSPKIIEVHGHKMLLDSKDSLHLSIHGTHEPFETDIVKKEIRVGDTVLDIGANIGYFTLLFAKQVGPRGKVFAFEPDPTNYSILKKNIEMNGYNNVILIQKAVSDTNGKIRLYLSEDNKGDHRIYDSYDNRQFVEIDSIRLDDYFKDNPGVSFIKMDVQGAEGSALAGMQELLDKSKGVKLIMEFSPTGLRQFGSEPIGVVEKLIKLHFKLYHLNDTEQKILPIDTPESIEKYIPDHNDHINLYCVKGV